MSRTPKRGIDCSEWTVNVFDGDKKIDKLIEAQGWKGFGVYFYLCQTAYKLNGYYLEWNYDDCASTARKMGGGVGSDTVLQTVKLCLLVGLFDKGLFDRWGVLTSKGIQRRFWAVARERSVVPLYREYWLLAPDEAYGLDKCAVFQNLAPENADLTPPKADLAPGNGFSPPDNGFSPLGNERKPQEKETETKAEERKKKESNKERIKKEGERKEKEKEALTSKWAPPSREEVRDYVRSRNSNVDPDLFFDYFDVGGWIDSKGNPVRSWKQKLITWEKHSTEKQSPKQGGYSFLDMWREER